ncbi:iron complex outermembrane recepter protein [Sphingomonas gellani]|uniref:Iron complex outermembrane recepter protein n=1 Tax=Sphingomonas gellani TaxID=1166340 RepID=A0A1H8AU14_9SPHN|nr:TonB-dependent siderophore receptor [Sphingomonas gellani]SEM74200.1 iron complex outermembrane recepter protein [Sphingomonas gellani]
MNKSALTVCAIVLASGSAASRAQEYEQNAAIEQDVVVTAQQQRRQVTSDGSLGALGDLGALETPFNVRNYTAQLVLDQQAETLGEVLENDPSVRTTQGFGNQSELFVIRGFPLNGDDVALDGLYGITPRQLVSPELYERVQVLNGSSAFLFGAAPGGSGLGGGINLTPKRADKTLLRATVSYAGDKLWGGAIDVGTRFGANDAFGLRVNGVYRDGDTAVDDERRSVRVVGADFDFRAGPGRFFLDFGYEDQRVYQPRPQVRLANTSLAIPRVPGADANYAQPWAFTKLRDVYVLARAEVDVAPDWTVYIAGGLRDGREDGDYATPTVTNSTTGAATQARLFVPREDNNESGQLGLRGKFALAGTTHAISVGATLVMAENRNAFASGGYRTATGGFTATTPTNIYEPVAVPRPANLPGTGTGGNLADPPRASYTEFGSLFASDTIGLFNDRLLVTGGVRQQKLIVEGFNRATFVRATRYDRSAATPVVGIVVRPTSTFSLYGNRIDGLVQGPTAPNTATVNPGEIFAPYRTTQYEVGAKWEVHRLTTTLALYRTTQPNGYTIATPTPANPVATTFVVDGRQRNQGIELGFNGEPTDWLRVIGGGTINDATLRRTAGGLTDGNTAIGVPDYQVNFGLEVVPPFLRAATLTGRVVHTGHQYLDATNRQRLDDWTRFDLGMRYILVADDHPVTLRVSAENIANRRYWTSAFGGYLLQGQPRTVKASITVEY